jgi:hypothetical protein
MATRYRIEVRGRLPSGVAAEFPGMTVEVADQVTQLRGSLPDAAALYGSIARLEALGLVLIAVRAEEEEQQ